MATRQYLAMTAAEIANCSVFPPNIGWMACHFSPDSAGLSNLPQALPEGSLLILDDQQPIHGHDHQQILTELSCCIEAFHCPALLLDFQRPNIRESSALIKLLLMDLPCTVVVSDLYARDLDCPVFVPPVPPSVPLSDHIAPWKGRNIWLEIGLDGEALRLTEKGCTAAPLPRFSPPGEGHREEKLHCHYRIAVGDDAQFTLWRTRDDLQVLMAEAEKRDVSNFVGLYQELEHFPAYL